MSERREHEETKKMVFAALASQDKEELKGYLAKVSDAYKKTIELCRPLLTRGNTPGELVGITIALRQMAEQNIVQCENMGIQYFREMVEVLSEGVALYSVAWKSLREESEDE